MRTNLLRLLALLFALTMVAAACTDDATAEDEDVNEESETTDDEAVEEEGPGTVVDVAVGSGDFPTLVAALTAAGLVDTLSGDGPFTVFAPTEEAFADALDALGLTAEELLASPDLSDILTYHVVPGKVLAADVVGLDGESVATVNGAEVNVSVDGDTVMINEATVVNTDIDASNGVIHVIDTVLLPPSS
jgi:uncharacterized surface protein with fasciclin (FAS1) repeats